MAPHGLEAHVTGEHFCLLLFLVNLVALVVLCFFVFASFEFHLFNLRNLWILLLRGFAFCVRDFLACLVVPIQSLV